MEFYKIGLSRDERLALLEARYEKLKIRWKKLNQDDVNFKKSSRKILRAMTYCSNQIMREHK
jgi:TRAP-type mannitol/chloroaromatic compound transport system substrate-binding protein